MLLTHVLDDALTLGGVASVLDNTESRHHYHDCFIHYEHYLTHSKSWKHSLCLRSWQTSLGTSTIVLLHSWINQMSVRAVMTNQRPAYLEARLTAVSNLPSLLSTRLRLSSRLVSISAGQSEAGIPDSDQSELWMAPSLLRAYL